MKTVTNCAEKKAKQILNLLQGYTKGIRITAILILLLMGVGNSWAYTLYLYTGNFTSWEGGSAKFQVYVGNTDYNGTSLGNHWYSFNVGDASGHAYIKRRNSDNNSTWNEFQADISSTNNVVHVTNWNEGYVLNYYIKHPWSGSWSWQTMTFEEPNKYTYVGTYNSSSGANVDTYKNENDAPYFSSITNSSNVNNGVPAIWTYTPSSKTLRIDPAYILTVESDGNGTASGSQSKGIKMNTNYDILATASEGYVFDKWTVTSGSATFGNSANASTTVKVSGNASATVKATFKPASYSITYKDQGGGAFSGTHETDAPTQHIYGTATALKKATKTGYTFDGWFTTSDCTGSAVTSLGATEYTADITLYAEWTAKEETKYDVTISANANGSVDPSGKQKVGATGINVTATPNPGYQFKQWSYTAGAKANPLNTATTLVTATGNGTVTASFEEILYDITITSNNAAYGDVNPKSTKAGIATIVKIEATPVDGYEFVNWTAPSSITLENANKASTTITKATANGTVSAKFQEKKHDVIISYKYGNTSIHSDAKQSIGEAKATNITAQTFTGYTFTGWTLGSGIVNKSDNTTTNPISITTNSNGSGYTLTANYEKAKYTLTFGVQGGIGGSVKATVDGNAITSPSTLEHGTQITLTATAKDGYKFSKWVNGSGAELSTEATYSPNLTANTTIKAVFTDLNVLYLKPNSSWSQSDAWFAAYFYNGSGGNYWVKMTCDDPCEKNKDYYRVKIPQGTWTHVIFVRMGNDKSDLNWDSKWNQTGNLEIPTNGNNLFTVPVFEDGKSWDGATTTWSTYTSTYEPVTYNVTVPAGTPNCYICGGWNWNEFIEMTKVDDTHYTITLDIACEDDEYKYCYGPSWDCQELQANCTAALSSNRTYSAQDEVACWKQYCLVGDVAGHSKDNWPWTETTKFNFSKGLELSLSQKTYEFKVRSSTGEYLTSSSQDNNIFTRSHAQEYVPQTDASWHRLKLEADIAGTYIFTFNPVNKMLSITFPTKGYQLQINMTDGTKYTSNAVEETTDIMSFFAPGESDGGSVQLYYNGSLKSTIDASTFKTSGVYTAKLNANKNGITDVALYEGNYYIRTDGAHGGWNNYEANADNKMTYFVPREKEKYSYYWVAALPQADRNESNGVVNVKACVGNDYNENLAVTLGGDKFTDGYGNVTIKDPSDQKREKINVRFGYNPKTNHFERAMLTGSGNMPNFLNITDPEGLVFKKDKNTKIALTEANSDSKFTDVSNWVYETNVWVEPDKDNGATVCLTSTAYNDKINSLFGFEADGVTPKQETIIGKNSGEPREMRIVYDFKTNRMIMAWIPGDITISDEEALHADVLFIRHENDDVPQLKLTGGGMIKDIQSQFFALELENDANKQGGNKEHAYWISLPFDCVVGSISGVPGYMETWGIQRYDGAERAQKGWFKETETFWKWLGPDDVMEAGVGYVLSFDKSAATWNTYDVHEKDANGNTISTTQKSLLRLYFPSTKTGYLFKENTQLTSTYNPQPCEIDRDNRRQQDSNWRIIATTSYYNAQVASGEDYGKDEEHEEKYYLSPFPYFRYNYVRKYDDKTGEMSWDYEPEHGGEGAEYKSFHSYMVQYAGTITWKALNESVMPAGLAARRNSNAKATNITTRLVIADAEEVQHDQTFVALDEKGTTTFDQNLDLNKIFNNGKVNIYTLSEGIPFAGNTLPMEEAVVPVGVEIAAEGEYTFRMPDGTEGMVVELIDYETGTTTNMLLNDYTVTLSKGTHENRFALHVQPSKSGVTTGVGNIGDEAKGDKAKGIEKYLIDGKLIIRTAEGIFDAQGHRL